MDKKPHEFSILLTFLSHFWVKRAMALTDSSSHCWGRGILGGRYGSEGIQKRGEPNHNQLLLSAWHHKKQRVTLMGDFTPQETFGHIGDIFSCHNQKAVTGIQGYCQTDYNAQDRLPQQKIIQPRMSVSRRFTTDRRWSKASYMDYVINIPNNPMK